MTGAGWKKRYEYGTDDGKGDHHPAGATRARAAGDSHEARKVLMSGQPLS